ncbi:unnamed protein product [Parnassius apollo]|uniref:(apollo) hypothetical protein n=1 Tax=Parnassius apollo TaxID=110799 RepID=A0A8S3YCG8_PARAO|nr:unnamed protein product [Parnassius apollo]
MLYDPGELLRNNFNLNSTTQERSSNGIRFEGENDSDFVSFDRNEELPFRKVKFPPENTANSQVFKQDNDDQGYRPIFEDNGASEGHQKRRKRRRKPRLQRPEGISPEYVDPYAPNFPQISYGARPLYNTGFPGPIYRPPTRPRPSLASEALSSVTEALTSIALYDDRQCVARLLCEAASGGALGSSQTLQSVTGLQPLLTLLSAYSGISSNPLFVFGRAALLGMSSKNNPASCRYAYSLCPTDPEQLVYYLNNHNGGFFRFFNAPHREPQNINQLYNHLSQNYQSYQQVHSYPQNIGLSNDINQNYQQNLIQDYNLQNANYIYNYGRYGVINPNRQNKYGLINNIKFKNTNKLAHDTNKIEKRIQNRPEKVLEDLDDDISFGNVNDYSTKWSFPEPSNNIIKINDVKVGKHFKFPEISHNDNIRVEDSVRNPRGFVFPNALSNQYIDYNKYQTTIPLFDHNYNYNNNNNLYFDNYKGYNDNYDEYDKDQSIRTVYVVRGNGDPNHPEIIRLRPGQTVY